MPSTQTFDLHLDSLLQYRLFRYRIEKRHRALLPGQPLFWHADLPRMRDAAYKGACMGVHYWPTERESAWEEAKRQVNAINALCEVDGVQKIGRDITWMDLPKTDDITLGIGVEGAHMLNGKLERLQWLQQHYVSYLTLTHFSKNQAATPSIGRGTDESQGLTSFGIELLSEAETLGIAIDLAHLNRQGVLDACKHATKPLICTHTGVCGIHEHARNITDEEIDAIADNNGLIGVMAGPIFLAGKLIAPSTIIADHIEYLIHRVGLEHVAIGTDFDGWLPSIPKDWRDCRDIQSLYMELAQRGYTSEQLDALGWKNAIHYFHRIASN